MAGPSSISGYSQLNLALLLGSISQGDLDNPQVQEGLELLAQLAESNFANTPIAKRHYEQQKQSALSSPEKKLQKAITLIEKGAGIEDLPKLDNRMSGISANSSAVMNFLNAVESGDTSLGDEQLAMLRDAVTYERASGAGISAEDQANREKFDTHLAQALSDGKTTAAERKTLQKDLDRALKANPNDATYYATGIQVANTKTQEFVGQSSAVAKGSDTGGSTGDYGVGGGFNESPGRPANNGDPVNPGKVFKGDPTSFMSSTEKKYYDTLKKEDPEKAQLFALQTKMQKLNEMITFLTQMMTIRHDNAKAILQNLHV